MPRRLKKWLDEFERVLVETLDNNSDSSLYLLKYYSPNHTMVDIQKFETLSVLGSSRYEHFNVHMKQKFKIISYSRETRLMETVSVMKRSYKRVLRCEEEELDGKSRGKNERSTEAERDGLYLIRDWIKINMDKMA